jgi:hypothetical protein
MRGNSSNISIGRGACVWTNPDPRFRFLSSWSTRDLRSLCPLVVALAWGGEDSRLAVRVHHALSLEEAVETADFQLKVTELLVHYGALCLRLYMRHL